jgi:putative lipoprotein
MIRVVAMLTVLTGPPSTDRWFGADKLKHFLMSALVQSTAFSAARAAGIRRPSAQIIAGVSTVSVGLLKEIHDRRVGKPFSVADLTWDAGGGVSAAALLNGTR